MTTGDVFFGWLVAPSFAGTAFLSSGVRLAVGPSLKPMARGLSGVIFEATDGYAAAFVLASMLLLAAAALSVTIDERRHPLSRLAPARVAAGK